MSKETDAATIKEIVKRIELIQIGRNATVMNIEEMSQNIKKLNLFLEAYRTSHKDWQKLAADLGITVGEAMQLFKDAKQLANRPIDKQWMIANGILPQPRAKTPKKKRPTSCLLKVGNLQGEILLAVERGASAEEIAIMKDMLQTLIKKL